jgi:hypothetical protein
LTRSAAVQAEVYGFKNISNNSAVDVASQLSVEVTPEGEDIKFTFSNSGSLESSITGIYFAARQDTTPVDLLDYSSAVFAGGIGDIVDFAMDTPAPAPAKGLGKGGALHVAGSSPPGPPRLPGGLGLEPAFLTDARAGAKQPGPRKGVGAGELLSIVFPFGDDAAGSDASEKFASVIAAINRGFLDPTSGTSLRLGLQVQSIEGGGDNDSDQFLMVPVPGAALLGMLGLCAAGLRLRRSV